MTHYSCFFTLFGPWGVTHTSISSFLFAIISESLTFVIKRAHEIGVIKGVNVGEEHVSFTHLQFADDTLIFLSCNSEKVMNFKRLLECFNLMIGSSINYEKSSLVSWGVNND